MNLYGMTFRFTKVIALGAVLVLAACSGSPKAKQNADTLKLINESSKAQVFTPRAVLTIAPTNSPVPTATSIEPTSTALFTATLTEQATATMTKLADTRSSTPNEIPPTETSTPTEPVVSGCPQGCLQQSPGCDIKGNINNEGVKIYHMPSQNYYNQTKISPEKGERWFCTPAEAEANGWRASKQ